jgi:putative FmdB family regulatory protein
MPTYEYKCDACGHAFEKFQSMKAAPVRKCPECGKNKVQRLISTGAGLIFKGSGFYITDYRSESYKSAAKADSGTPAKSDASGKPESAGKTDAKPAEAAKPAPTPASSKSAPSDKKGK